MNYSSKLQNLLKNINLNIQKAQPKNNNTEQKSNNTLKFNNGEMDSTKDYGGLIQFSRSSSNINSANINTAMNMAASSKLKQLLENIKINTQNIVPKETVSTTPVRPTVQTTPTIPTTPTVPTTPTIPSEPTIDVKPNFPEPEIIDFSEEKEVGEMGYILNLLNLPTRIVNNNLDGGTSQHYINIQKDDQGRVISFDYTSSQAVLNSLTNFSYHYDISYEENGEIIITKQKDTNYNYTIELPLTMTFDKEGNLTKEVSGNTTKIYDGNGGYTETTVDEEGNTVKTVVATKNEDNTMTLRTDKPNGSWNITVKDENGNVISQEGKEIFSDNGINNFTINGLFICRREGSSEMEVTYSINKNDEMTVNASNVLIESNNIINLTVKGDNNIVNGSKDNDNVKVIGDNNQIDLGEGFDSANIIGDNNTVKNTEKFSMREKTIPEGEVGSLDYVRNLLNLPEPQNPPTSPIGVEIVGYSSTVYTVLKTDDEGRITEFTLSVTKGGLAQVPSTYTIVYDKNGNISEITETIGFSAVIGGNKITKTYNGEGKLIKEKSYDSSTKTTTEIEYGDGITTKVVTVENNNGKPLSVEKTYTTDSYVSVFKDEFTYDEENNMTQKLSTTVVDDVQLERVTTNYDLSGVETSKIGEITLRTSSENIGNRTADTYYMYPINIRNPKEENATFTYIWTFDGTEEKLELNVNEMEILPGSSDSWNISNVIIRGNRNTIKGSYHDDNIEIYGNNNKVDLAEGDDTLNIVGFNNIVENTENVSARKTV